MWRSLVAHLHGVQGVEGSNPLTPTNKIKDLKLILLSPYFYVSIDITLYINNLSDINLYSLWGHPR